MKSRLKQILLRTLEALSWSDPFFKWHRAHVAKKAGMLTDFLSNRLVGSAVLIDAPEFRGKFYLHKESHLVRAFAATGSYEPEVVEAVKCHLSRLGDAIDVGANAGLYVSLMARSLGAGKRLLAIEPQSEAYGLLVANTALNELGEVVILENLAVAGKAGLRDLYFVRGKPEYSSLEPIVHPATAGLVQIQAQVACETLDSLVAKYALQPLFIKIDAEGSEHEILLGAQETLKQWMPTLLMELSARMLASRNSSPLAVCELLGALGYTVKDLRGRARTIGTSFEGEIVAMPPA